MVSGPVSAWSVLSETGTEKRHAFCPTCGTPVYLAFPAMPGIIAVTAACLNDASRFSPRQVTWTRIAQPWDSLPPGQTAYARMPPA